MTVAAGQQRELTAGSPKTSPRHVWLIKTINEGLALCEVEGRAARKVIYHDKQTDVVDVSEFCSPAHTTSDEMEKSADKLVYNQQGQKKRKCSKSGNPGARAWNALRTTDAARRVNEDRPQILFNVSDEKTRTNHSYSTNSVKLQF